MLWRSLQHALSDQRFHAGLSGAMAGEAQGIGDVAKGRWHPLRLQVFLQEGEGLLLTLIKGRGRHVYICTGVEEAAQEAAHEESLSASCGLGWRLQGEAGGGHSTGGRGRWGGGRGGFFFFFGCLGAPLR